MRADASAPLSVSPAWREGVAGGRPRRVGERRFALFPLSTFLSPCTFLSAASRLVGSKAEPETVVV